MPALGRDLLLGYFRQACRPPERFSLGLEWELDPVWPDGRRATWGEEGGIRDLLEGLARDRGWERVFEGDALVALRRDGAWVTLEPGAQVELSTAPLRSVAQLESAAREFLAGLHATAPQLRFLPTSFSPVQPVESIPFVPKARYAIMQRYLQRRGSLAHGMMKGTSGVQVTVDFESEADCGAKLRAAMGMAPLLTALTAASPLAGGRLTGELSHRARCWTRTDPERTGLLDAVLDGEFTFRRYLDWVEAVPMMFYRREGRMLPGAGRTFREWNELGIDGSVPSLDDFELHLTSVFPEARLKRFIELRSMDNGTLPMVLGLIALVRGILYSPDSLAAVLELTSGFRPGLRTELREAAIRDGLEGRFGGRSLAAWVQPLLDAAESGLADQGAHEEVAYLAPLLEQLERGVSPGRELQRLWESRPDPAAFVEAIAYPPVDRIPAVAPGA